MKKYKINFIYNNFDGVNDIFIKVLQNELKKYDEISDSSFFCGDN